MKIDMLPPPEMLVPGADEVRVMTPEEIAAEEPMFLANGTPLPNPATCVFIGVFRGGKRVAFLALQVRLHAEPMYIEPGHSDVLTKLVRFAEKFILEKTGPQWVYLFAPAGRVAQLAAAMGMQQEPWVIMSKLVAPEIPDKIPPFLQPDPEPEPIVDEVQDVV